MASSKGLQIPSHWLSWFYKIAWFRLWWIWWVIYSSNKISLGDWGYFSSSQCRWWNGFEERTLKRKLLDWSGQFEFEFHYLGYGFIDDTNETIASHTTKHARSTDRNWMLRLKDATFSHHCYLIKKIVSKSYLHKGNSLNNIGPGAGFPNGFRRTTAN